MLKPRNDYEHYPNKEWLIKENDGHLVRIMNTLNYVVKDEKVLDVGAGVGTLAIPLKNVCDVTCVEIKKEYVDYLRSLGFFTIEGDARIILPTLKDNSYDTVILAEVIEHVENFGELLQQASRIARKKVIFSIPTNDDEWHYWLCNWNANNYWNTICMIKKEGFKDTWQEMK